MIREQTTIPNTEFVTATGNFDKTRATIDRIVIHTTAGTLAGAIATFGNPTKERSAHYIVDLDGKLYQGLEEYWTAYHAGNYAMNQRSIGIEHVDNGNYTAPRTDALYTLSSKLVADICKFYNIPCDRQHILKHNEIVATGCPHNLDIDRIVRQAQSILNPTPPPATNEWQVKLQAYNGVWYKPEDVIASTEQLKAQNSYKDGVISDKDKEIASLKGKLDGIKALATY